ncbi:hypothetical protein DFH06DRAFT_1476869 [Mycena polygramma]|nr:hypothetical protein DFH06DRAFT_1476869 [Mycena polygramma]
MADHPSTPSRDQRASGNPRSSRRGRTQGSSSSNNNTTTPRTPRTPRRATGAAEPSTSNARARASPVRPEDLDHDPQRDLQSEGESEDFPPNLLQVDSGIPTPIKTRKWKEYENESGVDVLARLPPGPDADIIELLSSDDELATPSHPLTRKRKRPNKQQNSPNKRARASNSASPSKKPRAASIINITSGDEEDAPGTRPATPPPVSDAEDVFMTADATDAEGIGDMAPDEPISLDDDIAVEETTSAPMMSKDQDSNIPDLNPSPPNEGALENEEVVEQLPEAEEASTATTIDAAESVAGNSTATGGEVPDTESRVEAGRFFDEALAQLDSDDTTAPKPSDVPLSTPRSTPVQAEQSESEDTTAPNSTPHVDEPALVQAPPPSGSSSAPSSSAHPSSPSAGPTARPSQPRRPTSIQAPPLSGPGVPPPSAPSSSAPPSSPSAARFSRSTTRPLFGFQSVSAGPPIKSRSAPARPLKAYKLWPPWRESETQTPACAGYTPPPVSPRSDSTLGATPPILPIALARIRTDASTLKQVDFDLDVCEDSDDDLEMPGYLPSP